MPLPSSAQIDRALDLFERYVESREVVSESVLTVIVETGLYQAIVDGNGIAPTAAPGKIGDAVTETTTTTKTRRKRRTKAEIAADKAAEEAAKNGAAPAADPLALDGQPATGTANTTAPEPEPQATTPDPAADAAKTKAAGAFNWDELDLTNPGDETVAREAIANLLRSIRDEQGADKVIEILARDGGTNNFKEVETALLPRVYKAAVEAAVG